MAALNAKRRAALPSTAFAYPATRRYPVDTPARARSALARASSNANRGTYRHVAEAVRRRYGNRVATVGPARGTLNRPGYRSRRTR